jgi:hypothetical protein
MVTHEQWTHAGDVVTNLTEWAVTAAFILGAAVVGSVLGSAPFLFLLDLIGHS